MTSVFIDGIVIGVSVCLFIGALCVFCLYLFGRNKLFNNVLESDGEFESPKFVVTRITGTEFGQGYVCARYEVECMVKSTPHGRRKNTFIFYDEKNKYNLGDVLTLNVK